MIQLLFLLASLVHSQAPVPSLNVSSYLGHWYQAYTDLSTVLTFENNSYCVTATYTMNENGTVGVLNYERQFNVTGPERVIHGWAAAQDSSEPGELTVHLQGVPVGAPYWIYELGPIYEDSLYDYSIVSDPFKLTLFVLARNLTRFAELWAPRVLSQLNAWGFTTFLNRPIATVQDGCWSSLVIY
jgi:lipocalin